MNQKKIIEEIQSLLHTVVEYKEKKGYYDFDYGYLYNLDVWECTFFDKEDNQIERFVGSTKSEIIKQLS